MKNSSLPAFSGRMRPTATALPIVLALLMLLSAIVLAFLARTNLDLQNTKASSSIVRNELLAQAAIETILGDLRAEMKAGSTDATQKPLIVTNAWAMVPARVVSSNIVGTNFSPGGDFANLVKQSLAGRKFYEDDPSGSGIPPAGTYGNGMPAGAARAGDVNTSTRSRDGRFISAARWNFPYLLANPGFTATNQLPDWVLITRGGVSADGSAFDIAKARSSVPLGNTDFVVGRYAYNIYDTGGLLDINVAGYPSQAGTNARDKGVLVWAELGALSGVDPSALVSWRNRISQASYATNMVSGTNSMLKKGFLSPFSSGADSDNYYFSRQDLIRYALSHSSVISTNALPLLTTFSREIDQPTFNPFPNRPKIFSDRAGGGNTEFGNDDVVNPNFAAISYNGGNRTVSPLPRRFPLSRLSEVATDPAARTGTAADIRKHFGLVWNEFQNGKVPAKCWSYEEQNKDGKIRTLAEVGVLGREANFVELLKAAISVGSLGGQAWPVALVGSVNMPSVHANTGGGGAEEGSVDRHIIQIAANIIDQADADNLPSRIFFAPASPGDCGRTYYGKEDLPYLYLICYYLYRQSEIPAANLKVYPKNDPAYPASTYKSVVMAHPVLWAPHSGQSISPGTFRPSKYRVVALSYSAPDRDIEDTDDRATGQEIRVGNQYSWWSANGTYADNVSGWVGGSCQGGAINLSPNLILKTPEADLVPTPVPRTFQPQSDYLEARLDIDVLRQPVILQVDGAPGVSNLTGHSSNEARFPATQLTISNTEMIDENCMPGSNQVIGFTCGFTLAGPWLGNKYLNSYTVQQGSTNMGFQYALEYQDADGSWVIYDVLRGVKNAAGRANAVAEGKGGDLTTAKSVYNGYAVFGRPDPRTDRFGPRFSNLLNPRPTFNSVIPGAFTILYKPANQTLRDSNDSAQGQNPSRAFNSDGASLTSLWTLGGDHRPGWLEFNQDTQAYFYKDPDLVARPGDGAVTGVATDITNPDGKMLQERNFPSRPAILNRPFRSVGELGYAFRDQPFKTLNFSDPRSADAALLDVFCIEEATPSADGVPVTAGKVNLNSRQPAVLQAVLQGVLKANAEASVPTLTAAEAQKIAAAVTAWTSNATVAGGGPFINPSEIVGKSTGPNTADFRGFSSQLPSLLPDSKDKTIKERREAVVRAFAGSTQTRTWNLLLDLIVQNGRYPVTATSPAQFLVEGERRYWVHLAIDRFTLEIVDRKIELVSE